MMFFCRGTRLSVAAALDQAFKSSSSGLLLLQQVQVKANGLGDVTWTLRNNNALKCSRAFCVTTGPIMGKRGEDFVTVENWDSSLGYFGRAAATIALNRSRTQQSVSGGNTSRPPVFEGSSQSRRRHTVGTCGSVVVLTGGQVCSPRWLLTAMQTRASSTTAAAARKHETGAGETSTDNKGEEQSLKEPPFSARKPEQEEGKPNKTQQLKKVFKEYGAVGVGFHVTISLMSLGMFYLLVSSGVDMAAVLCKVGFSEAVVQSKMAAGTSTFVLAYAVHKLFAPVRMSVTLVSVPLIVRYFRTTGLFKPPTPAP